MAHADWKRYFVVIARETKTGRIAGFGGVWKKRTMAEKLVRSMVAQRAKHANFKYVPVGIARVRGRKNNPELQTWLMGNSK